MKKAHRHTSLEKKKKRRANTVTGKGAKKELEEGENFFTEGGRTSRRTQRENEKS